MTTEISTEFKDAFLTFPTSIKQDIYCFKLNTDDHFDAKPIDKYLRGKGVEFKRTMQYSKAKCIGWHVYKIPAKKRIENFEENINFCKNLFLINN